MPFFVIKDSSRDPKSVRNGFYAKDPVDLVIQNFLEILGAVQTVLNTDKNLEN